MDVYEASANMIAFSEFVIHLAKSTFGESVETRASIAGGGRGSFVTDIVFNFAGASSAVFAALPTADPKTLWLGLKWRAPNRLNQRRRVLRHQGNVSCTPSSAPGRLAGR